MQICQKHVLLVDDEEPFLKSLSEGFEANCEGFEILTAKNGKKAVELFRSGLRIDLMVTDLNMPEMNGFELLAYVKKNFPATPAIVLTGVITPEIEEHLKSIGDYDCIEKTIELNKLWKKIIGGLRLSSTTQVLCRKAVGDIIH
ncbi:MAG: response regulator [Desulfobacteraceae bacterium]|nr:response regulator [Desulfobacteraceae bacterium]